jgi:hypothetical protein
MGLYSSNCRRFFVCHAANWEPLGQFTSNFTGLLELIVLGSVYFMVKFRIFIPELWDFIHQIVSELAKGFSICSVTYEKSPTIWWIKSHNSGMKNWNSTKKYTDRKTINSNRTPWPIHFKLRIVFGIDSLMVCILFGGISIFHSRIMGLYSSNCRQFFICYQFQ